MKKSPLIQETAHSAFTPWIIWFCAALFYFYEMILRASPSVMVGELMRDFKVTSTSLGVLTSYYYYSYVLLQIPCGMIVDRIGTRKVITFSTLLCVIGSLCFAYSTDLGLAKMGRFLIGAGSACAFISCLKISADWFLPAQFALIAGLTNMAGTIGGMFSGPPFAILVNQFGWRQATLIAAYIGIGLAAVCWVLIQEKPTQSRLREKTSHLFSDLLKIIVQRNVWIYAIFGGLMYVPISAFCELWSVPFLMEKYGVTNEVASVANVMIYLGIAIGSPVVVKISDRLQSRVKVMSASAFLTMLTFVGVLYLPQIPFTGMLCILFVAGLFNSGQILSFACVKESLSDHVSGTGMGFTNAVVMMSGFIFQPLLGKLLDLFWDGRMRGETPVYSLEAYQASILAVPLCLFASLCLLQLIRRAKRS